ncbi:MAG: hypothetical protein KF873_07450 [Gemmataceae bacterium]|nr:hypothetical protein [Gemmataceae bacterium]
MPLLIATVDAQRDFGFFIVFDRFDAHESNPTGVLAGFAIKLTENKQSMDFGREAISLGREVNDQSAERELIRFGGIEPDRVA